MMKWDARFQTLDPDPSFPKILNCAVETRRDLSYRCEGWRRKDRTCLFDLTLEGSGVFRKGDVDHQLGPGKAFLCELNDPSTAYFYPPGSTARWSFLWICFSGGGAAEMLRALTAKRGPVCELSLKSPFVRKLLAFEERAEAMTNLLPAESARLVLELLSAFEEAAAAKASVKEADELLVERAQSYALSRLESGEGVAEMAKALGVSREHLSRAFRRRAGGSLSEWLEARRMALAARMLRDEGLSCKELSWRLGYSSQANFSRAFKAATGSSPGRFKSSGAWFPL